MEKNMLVLYGSPRERGFTKELLKYLYRNGRMFIRIQTFIHSMHIKKIWHRVLLVVFVDKKRDAAFLIINCLTHCIAMQMWWLWRRLYTVLSLPAPLKAVFDRTQQYYEAYVSRHIKYPFEKPKKAFLLSVYGSNDKRGVEMMQQQLQLTFSVMNTKLIGTVSAGNTDCKPLNTKELQNEVKRLLLANISVL